jgi:hypothetical protein
MYEILNACLTGFLISQILLDLGNISLTIKLKYLLVETYQYTFMNSPPKVLCPLTQPLAQGPYSQHFFFLVTYK